MMFLLSLTAALALALGSAASRSLSQIAMPFHQACVKNAPESRFRLNYQMLVCASSEARPPHAEWTEQTKTLGLSHFFLMSGAQVFFIDLLAQSLARRINVHRRRLRTVLQVLLWANLLGLLLMSGNSGKILRALVALTLGRFSRFLNLRWSQIQILTAAGFITLFLTPPAFVLSVFMSWLASLTIFAFSPERQKSSSRNAPRPWPQRLAFHLAGYFILLPALFSLSPQHPLAVGYSFLIGAVFGPLLFPASLVAYGFPDLHFVTDHIWLWLEPVMNFLYRRSPERLAPCPVSTSIIAVYLGALTLLAWWLERRQEP